MKYKTFLNVWIISLIFIASLKCKKVRQSDQVVIGVLTLPSSYSQYPYQQYSQIVRAYVQYIQDSGKAITVPIHWDSSEEELDDILSKVNGVFLTGGGVEFMQENSIEQNYLKSTNYILEKAKSFNDEDNYFPVWGTCLGFQVINYITAGNDQNIIISGLEDYTNHSLYDIDTESKLFKNMPQELLDWIQNDTPAYYSHQYGISKAQVEENKNLSENIKLTSLSKTDDGEEFIATIEFKDYPIYAVQFHPEKNEFEPKVFYIEQKYFSVQKIISKADAQRDELSIKVSKYFIEFLIEECLKNKHSFEDKKKLEKLRIDNKQYVDIESKHHSSIYFLENAQNSDIDYDDRYEPPKFFIQMVENSNKKNKLKQI